jgi:subtilisin-like proprotein convertase family protein
MIRSVVAVLALVLLLPGHALAATKLYKSGRLELPIASGRTTDGSLTVPDRGPVSHVAVWVRIDDSHAADLTLTLRAPDGTTVTLAAGRGGSGRNYGAGEAACRDGRGGFVIFDDAAETPIANGKAPFEEVEYRPDQPLRTLNGHQARGRWTLSVAAVGQANAGRLRCFALDLSRRVVEHRIARAGAVTATLSFVETAFRYSDVTLTIARRGRVVRVDRPRNWGPSWQIPVEPEALRVRDLDGDREPEVVADFYSGGAHCCSYTLVYRYEHGTYAKTMAWWGNPGARLVDLDHDGRPEFRSGDDRFAYAFTAYAASAWPVRIWHYEHGRMRDVTRSFPASIAADARALRRLYDSARRPPYREVRGVLAAWVADELLLGRGTEAWAFVERAYRRGELGRARSKDGYPAGRRYVAALRRFLRRTGYL